MQFSTETYRQFMNKTAKISLLFRGLAIKYSNATLQVGLNYGAHM
jgi:hypothetical protein